MNNLILTGRRMAKCCLLIAFAIQLSVVTGCGPSDPDESELDRIPNVPPSTRGNDAPAGGGSPRVPGQPGGPR